MKIHLEVLLPRQFEHITWCSLLKMWQKTPPKNVRSKTFAVSEVTASRDLVSSEMFKSEFLNLQTRLQKRETKAEEEFLWNMFQKIVAYNTLQLQLCFFPLVWMRPGRETHMLCYYCKTCSITFKGKGVKPVPTGHS